VTVEESDMRATEHIEFDKPVASLIIRGRIITDNLIEVGGRGGDLTFLAPDAHRYLDALPLTDPSGLADLYTLSFEEILDYLEELGARLDIESNAHLRRACRLSYLTAPTTPSIVDKSYQELASFFRRSFLRQMAERCVGVQYLEGWVEQEQEGGLNLAIRCFGARTLHIVAGNSPIVSALTIARNAILRSDAIIKAPSNDPFTALAIAQTMVEMAPDHPLTRHLTVGYWRGGDVALEEQLYQPGNIEKIIAWGGFSSVKHVTRYIQPGLELISLDPKRSASIIGAGAFENETTMREAALRLASDIGALNQAACVSARVVYVQTGTGAEGIASLNRFGEYVYEAMLKLPESISTEPKAYDRELKAHVDAVRFNEDWYKVIGGKDGEGAIIVSQTTDEVDFSTQLNDRTANLVPVESLADVVGAVNSYTQTVGVYPESLKAELRDILPLYGAQRFVSLGFAVQASFCAPQDGLELMRRMGKWIIDERRTPQSGHPPWLA
jgi:hypothetical protein